MLRELGNETMAIPYFAVFVPGRAEPIHFNPPGGSFLSSAALMDFLKEQGLELQDFEIKENSATIPIAQTGH